MLPTKAYGSLLHFNRQHLAKKAATQESGCASTHQYPPPQDWTQMPSARDENHFPFNNRMMTNDEGLLGVTSISAANVKAKQADDQHAYVYKHSLLSSSFHTHSSSTGVKNPPAVNPTRLSNMATLIASETLRLDGISGCGAPTFFAAADSTTSWQIPHHTKTAVKGIVEEGLPIASQPSAEISNYDSMFLPRRLQNSSGMLGTPPYGDAAHRWSNECDNFLEGYDLKFTTENRADDDGARLLAFAQSASLYLHQADDTRKLSFSPTIDSKKGA
jgi:hypothetical protein